jgi:hypothetical protein
MGGLDRNSSPNEVLGCALAPSKDHLQNNSRLNLRNNSGFLFLEREYLLSLRLHAKQQSFKTLACADFRGCPSPYRGALSLISALFHTFGPHLISLDGERLALLPQHDLSKQCLCQ